MLAFRASWGYFGWTFVISNASETRCETRTRNGRVDGDDCEPEPITPATLPVDVSPGLVRNRSCSFRNSIRCNKFTASSNSAGDPVASVQPSKYPPNVVQTKALYTALSPEDSL